MNGGHDVKLFLSRCSILLRVTALALLTVALVFPSAWARQREKAERPDPAITAMLGSACSPETALLFIQVLQLDQGDTRQFADHFKKGTTAGGGLRFEAENLTVDATLPGRKPFRVQGAHLVLEPSGNGGSVHFELDGPIFGAASKVSAVGTVQWGKGPLGGDKLTVDFAIDDADLEVLRVAFPERFDPAFAGPLNLSGHGEGVVGEQTTEDAPATPLKGKLDGSVDWVVMGRRDSLVFSSGFSLDDRSVRLSGARLKSFGLDLDVSGWFDPDPHGQFHLNGAFAGVEVAKVTADWLVPPPWQAVAALSGKTEFWGKPGQSYISYDAKAADVSIPGLGGYPIRTGPVRFIGRLLAINAEVSGSVQPTMLEVGPIRLDALSVGVSWWRNALEVVAANTSLWGGTVATTFSYRPATSPAFEVGGRLDNMRARDFASRVLPAYGIDVDGTVDVAYRVGQDADAAPYFAARVFLAAARLGSSNVFEQALAALASMPTPLSCPEAAVAIKKSKSGAAVIDKLFFEIEKRGDGFAVGGISGHAGVLQLDGSGTMDKNADLDVEGAVYFPPAATEALFADSLWAAPLRAADGGLFVPVHIGGKSSDLKVTLTPAFAAAVAKAHAGQPVIPFGLAKVEHVATSGLATLAEDPAQPATP